MNSSTTPEPGGGSRAPARRRSWKFATALGAFLFAVVSGLYVLFLAAWYVKLAAQEKFAPRTIQSGFILHPFLTSDQIPHQRIHEIVPGKGAYTWALNGQGCRDDREYAVEKKPGVVRWLCLGGSALVCGSTNAATIPARLQAAMDDDPEWRGRVEVLNFGHVGWESTQELIAFATELRKYNPDFLLVYDGRNDAFQASMPEYRPFWNSWNREANLELNQRSHLKDLFYPLHRLDRKVATLRDPRPDAIARAHILFQQKSEGEWDFYRAHPEIGEVYAGNLRAILNLARGNGCRGALLVLQPQLHWCGKPLSFEERTFDETRVQPSWRQAMMDLFPVLRKARLIAPAPGDIPFETMDTNPLFTDAKENLFADDCHLNDEGNRIVAAALAPKMKALMKPREKVADPRPRPVRNPTPPRGGKRQK